ncbi:MAG: hypothetical protein CVV33_08640, partial [Methanomicrobiales archaeon HGW-Methanomicrobiales-4]
MRKMFLRQFVVIFLMFTFVLLPLSSQAGSGAYEREEYVLDSSTPSKTFPIMRPDDLTIRKWQDRYERAPRARIDERYHHRVHPRVAAQTDNAGNVSSTNLLDLLTYSPSESQGSCGDCWAWAGTRVMGVDLNTQQAKAVNLSVQFTNSCYGENSCCGGWLSDIVDFYNSTLMTIPTSNTNAAFQDGTFSCSASTISSVSCSSISTSTNYPIASMAAETVTTTGVAQAMAISNIKNILNQGKAIWFAFYLPNKTAWNNFYNFWNNQSESALWNPDTYCGQSWSSSSGGGHAVTLVGYDDSDADTANHYWILVNSWGTTATRPNGVFRVRMYVNYGCTFSRLSAYALGFQTLNIAWEGSASGDTTAPTVTAFTLPSSSTSLTVSINSFTAMDDVDVTGYMVTNSSTKPTASASGWSASAPTSYTFSSSTTSGTKTLYAWAKDAAGNVSVYKSASVIISIAGTTDLIISAVSNKAKTITAASRSFSITETTKNQGTASAPASTTKYYLSTTNSKTSSAILLSGTRSVAALVAGGTSSGSVNVQ